MPGGRFDPLHIAAHWSMVVPTLVKLQVVAFSNSAISGVAALWWCAHGGGEH